MPKPGFRLPPYQNHDFGSAVPNDFNDLENRKSRGTPPRGSTSRKRIKDALDFLDRNLPGLRRGTSRHDHLVGRIRSSGRPLTTAKTICRDYLKVSKEHGPACDASDVQELW